MDLIEYVLTQPREYEERFVGERVLLALYQKREKEPLSRVEQMILTELEKELA